MTTNNADKKSGVIALVPARGGSKGLPGKNLMKVQGISLVARAVQLGLMTPKISRVILSSDDDEIIEEGKRVGCEVPFRRPPELSRSDTPMLKVLEHAIQWIREDMHGSGEVVNGLVVLQPTSPMRRLAHIIEALDIYDEKKAADRDFSGVMSVSPVPVECSPFRTVRAEMTHLKGQVLKTAYSPVIRETIDKEPLYYRNGAVIVLDPDCLSALNSFHPQLYPYVIHEPLISIDSLFDLQRVEFCGRMLEPCFDDEH